MRIDPEKRDKGWLGERKRELDALLDFSNMEILPLDSPDVGRLVYNCRLFEQEVEWQSFVFASRDSVFNSQDLTGKKKILLGLQDHLRRRLERIISFTKKSEMATISEVTGTMVFSVHPAKGRFLLELKQTDRNAAPLEKEKMRLDFRLIDLAQVLGLKPGSFKRCLKCGHFFCQSTSKERLYCSPRCSGAARQVRFQKKGYQVDMRPSNVYHNNSADSADNSAKKGGMPINEE